MADVYLGRYTGSDTQFNETNDNLTSIRHSKGTCNEGLEYIIKDPERELNIRYLDGVKPPGTTIEMRDRMQLIYATSSINAAQIIQSQNNTYRKSNSYRRSWLLFVGKYSRR